MNGKEARGRLLGPVRFVDLIEKIGIKSALGSLLDCRVDVYVENVVLEFEEMCCFCCDISFGETFYCSEENTEECHQGILGVVSIRYV